MMTTAKPYTVADLEAWVRELADVYFHVNPEVNRAWYRPTTDFHPEEAQFMRALQREVVIVDWTTGRTRLPDLNTRTGEPTQPRNFLHSRPATAVRTRAVSFQWREWLTQAAVLTELIADHGWAKELVAFDPDSRGRWAFDLAVFESVEATAPWLIAAETKSARSWRELDTLRDDLLRWSAQAELPSADDSSKSAKAFRELWRHRPKYLWFRAPGRIAEVLRASYGGRGRIDLTLVDDIPTAAG
jgi:hypothetical protein